MHFILRSLAAAGLALALTAPRLPAQAPDVPPGVEIQARGPVHEAYAEASDAIAAPGAVVVGAGPMPGLAAATWGSLRSRAYYHRNRGPLRPKRDSQHQ